MATATRTSKPRKSDLTVSLCLAIDHQAYSVTPIRAEDPDVTRAWRLEKRGADGAVYDVATTTHGHQCDCPDWEVRRNGIDPAGCKHIKACVQMGLLDAIPAAAPTPKPTPIDDFYARDQAAMRAWNTENGIEDKPAPARCCGCHRDSVCEEGGMPWCSMCYDRMIQTPVAAAPCCSPAEPPPCLTCSTPCTVADCQRNTGDGCQSDIGHGLEPIHRPADLGTELLEKGLELAAAEALNQPVALPDRYPDEAPEGPSDLDFAEWEFFRENPAAVPPAEPFDPSPEDDADFAAFKRESAARSYLDHSDRLTLAELVDRQSDFFRGWGNAAGEMIARTMEELAMKIRLTNARTPAELEGRIDALEADVRESWEAAGYEAGRQAGCRCGDVIMA